MNIKSESITIRGLLELKKNGMLTINPEYQRAAVWTENQQKKLIDSVMRSYPLPLFYFHHKTKNVAGMKSEGLEIIDGQQRINALYFFQKILLSFLIRFLMTKQQDFQNSLKKYPVLGLIVRFWG